jgi:hypothetical protein
MNVMSRATFAAAVLTTALLTSQTALAQQASPANVGFDPAAGAAAPSTARAAAARVAKDLPASGVADVALQEDGVIRGRVLHSDGRPIDGSRVVIKKGERIAAAVISEANGQFQVKGLASGVYQIETPTGYGTYRFWTKDAAPPSAMTHALLVSKEPVLRGQFGLFTPQETFALAVGATGLAIGVVALDRLDDQEGDIKRLQRQNALLKDMIMPVSP